MKLEIKWKMVKGARICEAPLAIVRILSFITSIMEFIEVY